LQRCQDLPDGQGLLYSLDCLSPLWHKDTRSRPGCPRPGLVLASPGCVSTLLCLRRPRKPCFGDDFFFFCFLFAMTKLCATMFVRKTRLGTSRPSLHLFRSVPFLSYAIAPVSMTTEPKHQLLLPPPSSDFDPTEHLIRKFHTGK